MAIVSTDILFRYTTKSGAAGNSTASDGPSSLGKYASSTLWAAGGTLWDDVTGLENAASESEYRAIYIHNNHATLTLQNAVVWVSAETAGGASVAIAVDNVAVSAVGAAPAQGASIADENTAPAGVGAFSTPTTQATGLSLGNLGPGQGRMVWIRRTTANTGPLDADGFTLSVGGDTAA